MRKNANLKREAQAALVRFLKSREAQLGKHESDRDTADILIFVHWPSPWLLN